MLWEKGRVANFSRPKDKKGQTGFYAQGGGEKKKGKAPNSLVLKNTNGPRKKGPQGIKKKPAEEGEGEKKRFSSRDNANFGILRPRKNVSFWEKKRKKKGKLLEEEKREERKVCELFFGTQDAPRKGEDRA